jgi:hypothetical protein
MDELTHGVDRSKAPEPAVGHMGGIARHYLTAAIFMS